MRSVAAPVFVAVVSLSVVVVAATVLLATNPQQAAQQRAAPQLPVPTATVESKRLQDSMEISCALDGEVRAAVAPTSARKLAVVTSISVKPGDELSSGRLVATVSNRPIVAFVSSIPFFRDLAIGDSGVDVEELERGLVQAGLLKTADRVFEEDSAQALGKIYRRAGLSGHTGFRLDGAWAVPLGSIVSSVPAGVGDVLQRTTPVVLAAGPAHAWKCEAPSSLAVQKAEKVAVSIDGKAGEGIVRSVAIDEKAGGQSISITIPDEVPRGAEVRVTIVASQTAGEVPAIPAGALYGMTDGRSAIHKITTSGQVEEVPVEIGVVAGGWLEVTSPGVLSGDVIELHAAGR